MAGSHSISTRSNMSLHSGRSRARWRASSADTAAWTECTNHPSDGDQSPGTLGTGRPGNCAFGACVMRHERPPARAGGLFACPVIPPKDVEGEFVLTTMPSPHELGHRSVWAPGARGEVSATSLPRARNGEWRTQTSRSLHRPECPAKGSLADDLMCGARCGRDEPRQE